MGYAACAVGLFDEAREACRELSAIARADTERHIALHQLGIVARLAGNLLLALEYNHTIRCMGLLHKRKRSTAPFLSMQPAPVSVPRHTLPVR